MINQHHSSTAQPPICHSTNTTLQPNLQQLVSQLAGMCRSTFYYLAQQNQHYSTFNINFQHQLSTATFNINSKFKLAQQNQHKTDFLMQCPLLRQMVFWEQSATEIQHIYHHHNIQRFVFTTLNIQRCIGAAQGAEVEIDTEVVDHPGVDPETGQVVGKGVAVEVDTRYIYISSYSNQGHLDAEKEIS